MGWLDEVVEAIHMQRISSTKTLVSYHSDMNMLDAILKVAHNESMNNKQWEKQHAYYCILYKL